MSILKNKYFIITLLIFGLIISFNLSHIAFSGGDGNGPNGPTPTSDDCVNIDVVDFDAEMSATVVGTVPNCDSTSNSTAQSDGDVFGGVFSGGNGGNGGGWDFTPPPPVLAADIKANGSDRPITIPYNTAATLSWTSSNATACTASGDWSGSKPTSGSESTGNLTSSKTYTLTCTAPGGSASDSVTVNVPSPDFSLNSSNDIYATILKDRPGDSTATTITVTPFNGFSSTVNLSVQSVSPFLPAGSTFSFTPSSLNSSQYSSGSQFYVHVGPGLSASQTYTIIIQGEGGGFGRTATVYLNAQVSNPIWREI
jgi:hypothetical protein